MAYPTLAPTSRDFTPGDYPIKQFRSQSGAEVRILYGDSRTGMQMNLTYDNITDANADLFLDHYNEVKGTYGTFTLPAGAKTGWAGASANLDAAGINQWRYADAPSINAVRPGISSVQVQLIAVL